MRLLSWDDDLCSDLATKIAPEENESCTVCQKATCTEWRIIFASLLRIGREDYIQGIIQTTTQTTTNSRDGKPPLETQASTQAPSNIPGLTEKEQELFEDAQAQLRFHYLAGLVIDQQEIVKFDDGGVLPLIKKRRIQKDLATGSIGANKTEVFPENQIFEVEIHQDHHNLHALNGNSNVFALKTFRNLRFPNIAEDEFKAELCANRQAPLHKGITRLLAAFEYGGGFHLIFPFAHRGDLLDLWRTTNVLVEVSRPPWYSPQWLLKQCLGIAKALAEIHRPNPGGDSIGGNGPVPQLHADIKAKNILCFQPDDRNPPVLKLADFGCSREAIQDGTVDIAEITNTRTYRPPECDTERKCGLNFDVWCLGCLYLEFLTWAIDGYEGIKAFDTARMETLNDTRISKGDAEDTFFKKNSLRLLPWPSLSRLGLHSTKSEPSEKQTINTWRSPFSSRSETKVSCEIKPSVTQHIASLRKKSLFQPEFARLLDIIETKMLVVKSKKRVTSHGIIPLLQDHITN